MENQTKALFRDFSANCSFVFIWLKLSFEVIKLDETRKNPLQIELIPKCNQAILHLKFDLKLLSVAIRWRVSVERFSIYTKK